MIVLTGPTGNVGAEVARLFADASVAGDTKPQVRIAAHSPVSVRAALGDIGDTVEVARFDYDDRSTWAPVLDGIDVMFLVFPLPSRKMVGRRMTPFIDAAVAAGCRHIVYLTVPGADTAKIVPHYAVERHIEASGAAHTFLRASYFAQNLHRKVSTHGVDIAEHGEVFIPAGRGLTTFVDARDVAEVARRALLNPAEYRNQAYLITGPERLSFDHVATVLSDVLQRPVSYTDPSMPRFWIRMARRKVTADTIAFMAIVYTLTRFGKNEPLSDQLPQLLGKPARTFAQFASDAAWRWKQQEWT